MPAPSGSMTGPGFPSPPWTGARSEAQASEASIVMSAKTRSTVPGKPLGRKELRAIDAWWRAANYLSVGQIYLMDNPLLRVPLEPHHVKPRLLGHWGTTPGLTFIHAHLNRAIMARDLDLFTIPGPGHGGPAALAASWLDGPYTPTKPEVGRGLDRTTPHKRS